MIRDSVLVCLDKVSAASRAVNAMIVDVRREPLNAEEITWLFFGIGQILPEYIEAEHGSEAAVVREVRWRLERTPSTALLATLAIKALKEGMAASARKAPKV